MWKDRVEAGEKLASKLLKYKNTDLVIYALPRGGVILGREISKVLKAPLDLVIVRKIGHPFNLEYAVGAVALDGHTIFNENEKYDISEKQLEKEIKEERKEAERRKIKYLGERPPVSASGKTAIIVDDGVATGFSILLAIKEIKHQNPKRIIVAIPVIPHGIVEEIKKQVDGLVVLSAPRDYLGAVGNYYENFSQVEDDEVIKILAESN